MKWFNYNAAALTISSVLFMTMFLLGAPVYIALYAGVLLFVIGMLAKDFTLCQ